MELHYKTEDKDLPWSYITRLKTKDDDTRAYLEVLLI